MWNDLESDEGFLHGSQEDSFGAVSVGSFYNSFHDQRVVRARGLHQVFEFYLKKIRYLEYLIAIFLKKSGLN